MAIAVTINGTAYSVQEPGEKGWAQTGTDLLEALANNGLWKTGGSFTLTAEVDWGANFGMLIAYLTSKTANAASTGILRLSNSDTISWKNNAGSGDISLTVNSSDRLLFNGNEFVTSADIVNNLTSTDATKSLSAAQGKVLKDVQDTQQTSIDSNTTGISLINDRVGSLTKTAGHTIVDTDVQTIYCDFSADDTIVLPTLADNQDKVFTIVNISTGGWVVTVDGEGAELINSQTTIKLTSENNFIKIKAEAGAWRVQDFKITYETGWINRSDWTNVHIGSNPSLNVDSDVNHNFGCESRHVYVRFNVSTDGTDANAFFEMVAIVTSSNAGITYYGVDNDNLRVQTSSGGVYFVLGSGVVTTLDTDNWYYNVFVERIVIE